MALCLGEPPRRFCDIGCHFGLHFIFVSSFCCCSLFVVFLHFVSRLLYHVTGIPPCILRPMKASTSSELYPDYFWLPFLFHLLWALWLWVGIFYPQTFFTLRSFTDILTCVYQSIPGSQSSSLKFAGPHTDPWNTDLAHLFVWFTVIHNPFYILYINLYLYMSILQKFYLWWKLWWKNINIFLVEFLI